MACQDITKYGLFDLTFTNIDQSIVESLRQWVKSNRFQTQSDAHEAGLAFGIGLPIEDIPIKLNGDATYGDSHSNNWSDAFEKEFTFGTEKSTKLVELVKRANPDIIEISYPVREPPCRTTNCDDGEFGELEDDHDESSGV